MRRLCERENLNPFALTTELGLFVDKKSEESVRLGPKSGFLGHLAHRGVEQWLAAADRTADGEPPPRRGAVGDRRVGSAPKQHRTVVVE
jgi:hypothetical protein